MKNLLLLFVVILLSGCAGTFQPSAVCTDGYSAILTVSKGDPTALDRTLLTVNVLGLEKGQYTAADARKFFSDTRNTVNNGISYVALLSKITKDIESVNKLAGISIIILGADVPMIADAGGTNLISDCDKELILNHLAKQELLLAFYR